MKYFDKDAKSNSGRGEGQFVQRCDGRGWKNYVIIAGGFFVMREFFFGKRLE
jgi:hypothetical protein